MHRLARGSFVLLLSGLLGCSVSSTNGGRRDGGSGGGLDGGSTVRHDAGRPGFEECASEIQMAETRFRPVDIVWIIDNSGSMRGEATIVQQNMNDFAAAIAASGIDDFRVVVITRTGFVDVPPPLGTDAQRFRFVGADVQSDEGLSELLANFDLYADFLRPEAAMHFVVVTDDDSSLGWSSFRTQMESRLGRSFTFHTIASPPGSTHCPPIFGCALRMEGCQGPEDEADDNGDEYWALSEATGGQRFSICTNDWTSLFATLTMAVAVPVRLPCRYTLPETAAGTVDRTKVNMLYTPTGTTSETIIPFVRDYANCGSTGGWYYEGDDLVVCPATCSTLMADASGRVEIAVGCDTILF